MKLICMSFALLFIAFTGTAEARCNISFGFGAFFAPQPRVVTPVYVQEVYPCYERVVVERRRAPVYVYPAYSEQVIYYSQPSCCHRHYH